MQGEIRLSHRTETDPFFIAGPAVISFSGGRTSAYTLRRILDAHGGKLPENVLVCFQNTGREMPATLDFVEACAVNWGASVVWLEYRRDPITGKTTSVLVSHNSASRAGEPFTQMLAGKKMLPNPVMKFCTTELKVRALKRWLMGEVGWTHWTNIVGLRADEPTRVAKNLTRKPERWQVLCPLATAGVTKIDVLRFWKRQPFDLNLAGTWEGNCDGCFLKSRGGIDRMLVDHPERMKWWAKAEGTFASSVRTAPAMNLFRADRPSYAAMTQVVRDQGVLPMTWLEEAMPCTSGGCGI